MDRAAALGKDISRADPLREYFLHLNEMVMGERAVPSVGGRRKACAFTDGCRWPLILRNDRLWLSLERVGYGQLDDVPEQRDQDEVLMEMLGVMVVVVEDKCIMRVTGGDGGGEVYDEGDWAFLWSRGGRRG